MSLINVCPVGSVFGRAGRRFDIQGVDGISSAFKSAGLTILLDS
jgi:hypothetical protein